MALKVIHSASINRENNLITIEDITGADGLASSTKYSSGGNNLNKEITDNVITLYVITQPDGTKNTIMANRQITSVTPNIPASTFTLNPYSGNPIQLNTADLGLTPVQFPTGVYIIEVYVFTQVNMGGVIPPVVNTTTNRITGNTTAFDTVDTGFGDTDIIYIISQSDSSRKQLNYIKEILSSTVLSLSDSLDAAFLDGDSVTIYAGYKALTYAKADKDFMDCFIPKIAKMSITEKQCCSTCGGETLSSLTDMLLAVFDVEAQLSLEMYEEANKNVISLTKECKNLECSTC